MQSEWVEKAASLTDLVSSHADEADARRRLSPEVSAAFAGSGLYRIAAPPEIGGADVDPATQIAVIEQVSRADGASGWNLMIGIETFGLVGPGLGRCLDLIADPGMLLCSSTAAVGRAERVPGGWQVSGRWPFVSGIHNAQLFGATIRLFEPGNGEPLAGNRYALIPEGQYEILDTWHVAGMRGSGSHDVVVDGVIVPDEHIVDPIGETMGASPNLRYPRASRLSYNKVGVALGIGQAGLEAFVALANAKRPRFSGLTLRDRALAQVAVAEGEARMRGVRAAVFEMATVMWETVLAGDEVTQRDKAIFQVLCSDAVRSAARVVDQLCEAAGTSANVLSQPLERIARDVRVVRQHVTVAPQHIQDGGRVLLGLPPQDTMLKFL